MRILIAEDEATSAEVLKRLLAPYGKCDVVGDGEVAYQKVVEAKQSGNGYDLICLDIMMPNLDGIGALKKIRDFEALNRESQASAVKVIITTCIDTPNDVLNAFKVGCEGYVVKPIQKESLLREIRKLNLI